MGRMISDSGSNPTVSNPNTGGGGSGDPGGSTTTTTTETETEEDTKEQPKTAEASASSKEPIMLAPEEPNLLQKIITDNQLNHKRKIESVSGRTRITENLKNVGLFEEREIKLTISFPKEIVKTADLIISNKNFTVINHDPKIQYYIGTLEPREQIAISYSLPKELTEEELALINITLEKYEKTEQEKLQELREIEKEAENTKKAIDITTKHEIDYENNITTFTLNIKPKDNTTRLENVDILMEIPKCMIEILKEEDLAELGEFEIQNADPVIVWHVSKLITQEELRLSIKAIADEDCINRATVLAIAKDIVFLKHDIDNSKVFVTALLSLLFFMITVFAAGFSKVIEHEKSHIFKLIKRTANYYRHGWKTEKIKARFKKEKVPNGEIEEALSLNARDKLHYWLIRFGVGIEESIIFIIIILSFIDFFEYLPADADYIKKVVSWALMFIFFYHVSITRVLFGFKKHANTIWQHLMNLDFWIIIGFLLMLSKDMFVFARSVVESNSFTYDFLNLMARAQPVWEPRLFYAGLIVTAIISIMIAFSKEIYPISLSGVFRVFGPRRGFIKSIMRSVFFFILLSAFYFIVFDKAMEWLAISIDSHIVVILILFSVYFFLKHHNKIKRIFKREEIEEKAASVFGHIDHFYDHFIDLFHYKKTLVLGLMGMLILNTIVGVGVYFLPYLIARQDPLYSAFGAAGHTPIFFGESLVKRSLQALPFNLPLMISTYLVYIFNILAVLLLLSSIFYIWYWLVKQRHSAHFSIEKLYSSGFMKVIPFTMMSVVIAVLNPIFSFKPFYSEGKIGVDILSNVINIHEAYIVLIIGVITFCLSFIMLKAARRFTVRLYIMLCVMSFMSYISLFSVSIYKYLAADPGISMLQYYFVAGYSILFYGIGGVLSFIYLFLIMFSAKVMHMHLESIHHNDAHHDNIHGKKQQLIKEMIIKNMARGHELFYTVDYLVEHGYEKKDIEKAVRSTEKDARFEHAERNIKHWVHPKKTIKKLHRWIKEQLKAGHKPHELIKESIKQGYTEDDIILAFSKIKLPNRYKELMKTDYIEGKEEENPSDEDQYEDEEFEQIIEQFKKERIGKKQAKKLLKNAAFDERDIKKIIKMMKK